MTRNLSEAACNKEWEKVRRLVEEGENLNGVDRVLSRTALHWAVISRNADMCSFLLSRGVNVNQADTRDGHTPLHTAADWQQANICQLLVDHKADVTSVNTKGETPLLVALANQRLPWRDSLAVCCPLITNESVNVADHHGNRALHIAGRKGHIQIVQLLVDRGADVNELNEYGQTPLHTAAGGEKDCPELCSILLKHNAKVDAVDKDGNQPLHLAWKQWHTAIVRLLLSHGTDVTALNKQQRKPSHIANESVLKSCEVHNGNHALHVAAQKGHIQTVQLLVDCGADVHALNEYRQTPLHTAAGGERDCHKLCSILLEHDAKIDAVDKDGNRPLHLAWIQRHMKICHLLLSNGANANAWTKDGETLLHTAAGGEKDCPELCSMLLEHNAKINAVDKDGNQPLHLAWKQRHKKACRLLLSNGANANAWIEDGETLLHTAAGGEKDCPELCSMLLEHNAKINAVDKDGNRPLHLACKQGHTSTSRFLLSHGADVHALNEYRQTPLHTAAGGERDCHKLCSILLEHDAKIDAVDKDANRPLHLAWIQRHMKICHLLLSNGANANAWTKDGETLLHTAAGGEKDCPELCSMLLEHNAKINAVDKDGNQPLHLAWKQRHKKACRLLLSNGANANAWIEDGETLLHTAAGGEKDCPELCSMLLEHNAKINAVDKDGNRPLHLACKQGHTSTSRFLLSHGADVHALNEYRQTPLHTAAGGERDCHKLCSILLEHDAKIDAVNKDANRPLHLAWIQRHMKICHLLLSNGANANAWTKDGETLLHTAAGGEKDCPELCSMLLEHNAKINAVDKDGNQPLHLAWKQWHTATVGLLLSHGADVTALNKHQRKPLDLANESVLKSCEVHYGNHALHVAAQNGHIQTVQLLVDCGADVNALNEYGQTSLHTAAGGEKDSPELCSILLEHNAKVNAVDKDGNQPLHLACKQWHTATVRLLLSHGADVTALNKQQRKPSHMANESVLKSYEVHNGNHALHVAVQKEHIQTVQLLVDCGADVNALNEYRQTPLHTAAGGEKDCPELCSILLEHNAKVDAVDKDGNQPLHLACKQWHTAIVRLLLSHGADVTALNKQQRKPSHIANESILKSYEVHNGNHALHIAVKKGHIPTVQLLVDCGADVNELNKCGQTPLHTAAGGEKDCPELCSMLLVHNAKINAVDKDGNRPLHLAWKQRHKKACRLLLSNGANANAWTKDGETLLHTAAGGEKDCPELCSMLLEHNAKINAVDKDGNRPLHLACKQGHTSTSRFLLSHGADVHALNEYGQTPLHTAAGGERDCHKLCSILLEHDAKIDAVDKDANRPLHLAWIQRHMKICHLLLSNGANANAWTKDGETLLHTAAGGEKDSPELCSILLEHNAKVDAVDKDGNQPLHLAWKQWHTATVGLLLSHGADVTALNKHQRKPLDLANESVLKSCEVHYGNHALHVAAQNGHIQTVQLLVDCGADVNALNEYGQTSLHTAAGEEKDSPELCSILLEHNAKVDAVDKDGNQPLHLACKQWHTATVRLLLSHGADVTALNKQQRKPSHMANESILKSYEVHNGNHALHVAVQKEHIQTVQLLVDCGADVNALNEYRQTPLHTAAGGEKDCPELCSILLEHNAKVDAVDKDGNQPLHLACKQWHTAIVRLLLSHGADVTALNKQQRKPSHIANESILKSYEVHNGNHALHVAVQKEHIQTVQLLVDCGADVNALNEYRQTPLHTAAGGEKDCPELCSILLEHNAKVDAVDKDGNQPLHLACKQWHTAIVRLLLSHGADVTALNKQQRKPSHMANESILKSYEVHNGNHALHTAVKKGHIPTVQLLVDCGADVNELNECGQTPLHTAAGGEKDCPKLCSILLEHNAKVDAVDKDENQPLHLACKRGHTSTSHFLLSNGADVHALNEYGQTPLHTTAGGERDCHKLCSILLKHNAKIDAVDKDGNQPLHLAWKQWHTATVGLLLSHGADVTALNKHQRKPLDLANESVLKSCEVHYGNHALHVAAQNGHIQTVQLLVDCGADVNALNEYGQTSLHTAAGGEKDSPELCSILLEHNAKVNAVDKDGNQPLQLACKRGHTSTSHFLLSNGADVHALNEYGQTPLHTTAGGEKDCPELCSILLEHNAKVDAVDKDGNQPLHLACKQWHTAIVRLLLSHGADVTALNKQQRKPSHIANESILKSYEVHNGNDALHIAVKKGHIPTVQLLVDCGADVNALNEFRQTPLHTAAGGEKDCPELCSILLEHNAKVDAVDKDGNQPLHLACKQWHTATVRLLLSHRADVTVLNKQQRKPLDLANESVLKSYKVCNGNHALHKAVQKGHIQTVQLLVDCGADVNELNECGQTPLHTAAGGEKDCPELCSILLKHNAKIDAVDKDGNQPLHLACEAGLTSTDQRLLDYNADVFSANNFHQTVLHKSVCSKRDCSEVCEMLIAKGSRVNVTDSNGHTSLQLACRKGHIKTVDVLVRRDADCNALNDCGETLLHLACKRRVECVELCNKLISHGVNPHVADREKNLPLHVALKNRLCKTFCYLFQKSCNAALDDLQKVNIDKEELMAIVSSAHEDGDIDTCRHIFKASAKLDPSSRLCLREVNCHTTTGYSLIQRAVKEQDVTFCQHLIDHGASVNADVSYNSQGHTLEEPPLHLAVELGHFDLCRLLIEHGATIDPKITGTKGALHLAVVSEHKDIVRLLLSHGADMSKVLIGKESVLKRLEIQGKGKMASIIQATGE